MTICDDLPEIRLWGICNNLNQFVALRSASGLRYDVIKNGDQRIHKMHFKQPFKYYACQIKIDFQLLAVFLMDGF